MDLNDGMMQDFKLWQQVAMSTAAAAAWRQRSSPMFLFIRTGRVGNVFGEALIVELLLFSYL